MKLFIFFISLSSQCLVANELDLDKILNIARSQSDQVKIIEATHDQSEAEIETYRGAAFPRIDSDITVLRNSSPAFQQQLQGFGGEGPVGEDDRFYSTQYGINLSLSSPLFTFGRFGSVLDISKLMRKRSGIEKQNSMNLHYLKTIQLYSEALLAENLKQVAQKNLLLNKNLLEFTRVEFAAGARSRIDFLRVNANYELAKANSIRKVLEADNKVKRLKNYLGVEGKHFKIKKGTLISRNFFKKVDSNPKRSPLSIQTTRIAQNIADKTLSYHRSGHYPSLSLIGSASSTAFNPNQRGEEGTFKDTFEQQNQTFAIGVKLTWTIFDGFQTSSKISKAAAEKVLADLQLKQLEKEWELSRKEAQNNFTVANMLYEANRKASEAAKINMDAADDDYKAGKLTLTELLTAQKDFLEIQSEKFEAFSQKIISSASLRNELGYSLFNE